LELKKMNVKKFEIQKFLEGGKTVLVLSIYKFVP
jgi:hypothetical protein